MRRAGVDFWFPAALVSAVLVLSGLGISGSSLAIWSEHGGVDRDSLLAGTPRPVRSDEWLVEAPNKIGEIRRGFKPERVYGMGRDDVSWRQRFPTRSVGVLYKPFDIPTAVLPIRQGFALQWWLPFAACALGLYAWLRFMSVQRGVALCAAILVVSMPDAVWWSGWLPQTMSMAVVPCAVLAGATILWARRPRLALVLALAAGLAAASLPWLYPPWVIPLATFTAGITALWGLTDPARRRPLLLLGAVAGGVFAAESLIYYLHEHEYFTALANTAYPGERRFGGGGVRMGKLFSSVFPFVLVGKRGSFLAQENLSELSMGWTLFFPVAIGAAALGRKALRLTSERLLIGGASLIAVVLSSWCLVEWPTALGRLSMLALSPPHRMASLVGYFGIVLLALLLGEPSRRASVLSELSLGGAGIIAGLAALLTAWAATDFRAVYLSLPGWIVWSTVVVIGAIVLFLFTRFWLISLSIATGLALASAALVNPLMRGLGPIYDSDAARLIRRVDRQVVIPQRGLWAADHNFANSLLNAQGVDSLSSFNDPVDSKGWRTLDREGQFTDEWNRLGEIVFKWGDTEKPAIKAVDTNKVVVVIDPCSPRLAELGLAVIVSLRPLSRPCLTELEQFRWQGNPLTIYSTRRGLA